MTVKNIKRGTIEIPKQRISILAKIKKFVAEIKQYFVKEYSLEEMENFSKNIEKARKDHKVKVESARANAHIHNVHIR